MRPSAVPRGLALLAALLAAPVAVAQSYSGALAEGDDTLDSGEFSDPYPVGVRRGQRVTAVVTSAEFDTYVIVKDAAARQEDNDDCTDGETGRSCVTFVADRDGPVRVLVTSFQPGETGRYAVEIVVDGAVGTSGAGGASGRAGAPGPGRPPGGDARP